MGTAPYPLCNQMLREARRRKARLSQGSWRDDTTGTQARVLGDYPVGGWVPGLVFNYELGGVFGVLGQAEAGELPAGGGGEEVR